MWNGYRIHGGYMDSQKSRCRKSLNHQRNLEIIKLIRALWVIHMVKVYIMRFPRTQKTSCLCSFGTTTHKICLCFWTNWQFLSRLMIPCKIFETKAWLDHDKLQFASTYSLCLIFEFPFNLTFVGQTSLSNNTRLSYHNGGKWEPLSYPVQG